MFCFAVAAVAQTESTLAASPARTPTPPAAAPAPVWSVGGLDFSGCLDGYYGYNANRPTNTANGQINTLYGFNEKTDRFKLAGADLAINHNPDPIGVHADIVFGRTNALIHAASEKDTDSYREQAQRRILHRNWNTNGHKTC